MKKFLAALFGTVLLTTMLSSNVFAQDGKTENSEEPQTALIYGLVFAIGGWPKSMEFYQTDSRLPVSSIKTIGKAGLWNFYYGEANCDTTYKFLEGLIITQPGTIKYYNNYHVPLNGGTYFDFKAPKKPCVYYLGMKDENGEKPDVEKILERNPLTVISEKMMIKSEYKARIGSIKTLLKKYKGTKWVPLLNEELATVQAEFDAWTKEKGGDE